jgi:hypothetical protein
MWKFNRKQEKLDNLGTGRANYNSLNKRQHKKEKDKIYLRCARLKDVKSNKSTELLVVKRTCFVTHSILGWVVG